MKRAISSAIAICAIAGSANAATIYSGITFEDGDQSFADQVVDFRIGDGVEGAYTDPTNAIGVPTDRASFSLGEPGRTPDNLADDMFGYITLQFTDNRLTTSGDAAPDLFIFEIGSAVESYRVEISSDNNTWLDVGTVTGQPSSIDIDGQEGVNAGDEFAFVRLWDTPGGASSGNPYAGPDINAVGAISSVQAEPPSVVPLPAAAWAMLLALGALFGLRRRKHA